MMPAHAPFARPAACLLLAAAMGCNALTETQGGGSPVMVVVLNARTKGAGFTTYPVTNFYRVSSAAFSSATAATDSCRGAAYDPNAAATPIAASSIGGGAFVALSLSGRTDTLRKASTTDLTYKLASTVGLAFTPGDTITFAVAGDNAGFPGAVLSGRTAERFTLNPIVLPPQGQAMTLSWSVADDGNAAMLFSLRYNNGTGTGLNAQIVCDYRDDGSGQVPASLAVLFATSNSREVFAQRLRTALNSVSAGFNTGYFNMISTFDLPTPVSP